MVNSNEIAGDILTKVSKENLAQELATRDHVKELIYTYDDLVMVSGCNGKSRLSYETKGPVQILVLDSV